MVSADGRAQARASAAAARIGRRRRVGGADGDNDARARALIAALCDWSVDGKVDVRSNVVAATFVIVVGEGGRRVCGILAGGLREQGRRARPSFFSRRPRRATRAHKPYVGQHTHAHNTRKNNTRTHTSHARHARSSSSNSSKKQRRRRARRARSPPIARAPRCRAPLRARAQGPTSGEPLLHRPIDRPGPDRDRDAIVARARGRDGALSLDTLSMAVCLLRARPCMRPQSAPPDPPPGQYYATAHEPRLISASRRGVGRARTGRRFEGRGALAPLLSTRRARRSQPRPC